MLSQELLELEALYQASGMTHHDDPNMALSVQKNKRLHSLDCEPKILEYLHQTCRYPDEFLIHPNPRHWYDVAYQGVPINIKTTSMEDSDNLGGKETLLFLCYQDVELVNALKGRSHDLLHARMIEWHETHQTDPVDWTDASYLVIHKQDAARSYAQGLLHLPEAGLISSRANLLQVNWGDDKNREIVNRTWAEGMAMVYGKLDMAWKGRAATSELVSLAAKRFKDRLTRNPAPPKPNPTFDRFFKSAPPTVARIVVLNDGTTFTDITGTKVMLLTEQDLMTLEHLDFDLRDMPEVRTIDIEELLRLANIT